MGNSIQHLSDTVVLIASDDTWIEGESIQQLITTSQLPGMQRAVGLPDLHPGRGYPVGAAFFSSEIFYPALVGNDIGCGMALWATELSMAKPGVDALEKRLGSIDGPLDESWADAVASASLPITGYERSLGTIGAGNHFAELQQVDEILDAGLFATLPIDRRNLLLMVHSGSRGVGESILRDHVDQHGHAGLVQGGAEADAYLSRHDAALRFAGLNRQLIAQRVLARLKTTGTRLLDVNHNLVTRETIDGVDGWLHRKGATPADSGLVVIPGSRGDFSYLVQPVPATLSLNSLAHGAGRKWKRGDCRARLSRRYSAEQLRRTALRSRVICDDRELIYEEAPEAYKPIDSVVSALLAAGLVKLVARLRPVLSYKTRGECH